MKHCLVNSAYINLAYLGLGGFPKDTVMKLAEVLVTEFGSKGINLSALCKEKLLKYNHFNGDEEYSVEIYKLEVMTADMDNEDCCQEFIREFKSKIQIKQLYPCMDNQLTSIMRAVACLKECTKQLNINEGGRKDEV